MGLVTVALLTLAPLALRPVRLACLIHAANVHSEPGSNPSKSEPGVPPSADGARPVSSSFRVEESDWSRRAPRPRPKPSPGIPQPVRRSRPRRRAPQTCCARRPGDEPTPATLKGSTRTTIHHQPNCQRSAVSTPPAGATRPPLSGASHAGRRCRVASFSRAARVIITRISPRSTPWSGFFSFS